MLLKLLQEFPKVTFEHKVMSILGQGELTEKVRQNCSEVIVLDLLSNFYRPFRLLQAFKNVSIYSPDIIQGWMYHGNLFASLSHRFVASKSLVLWNIRCSKPAKGGVVTELVRKLCVLLSARPAHIIANSNAGMDYHLGIKYRPKSRSVIPNGVDTSRFAPDRKKRALMRASLSISDDAFVVGIAASFREMKDYPNFIRAVELLAAKHSEIVFLAAGRGVSSDNPFFSNVAKSLVKNRQLQLLGEVKDMPAFMNTVDVFTLSSKMGEGFPNVIAEAMACGSPCVVTDAGDSAVVVDQFGIGVPTQSPAALAEGWEALMLLDSDKFEALKVGGRGHIVGHYKMSRITQEYVNLYSSLLLDRDDSAY